MFTVIYPVTGPLVVRAGTEDVLGNIDGHSSLSLSILLTLIPPFLFSAEFPEQLPDMTLNREVSGSDVTVMHFPTPGPVQQSPREPIWLPPPETLVVDPGSPLLLSPFAAAISPVAGGAGHGPRNPEPGRVIIQVAPEPELLASAIQPAIRPPFTPNWAAAGSLPRGAGYYPAPLATTPVQMTSMSTTASSVSQAVQGGVAPQAPPPVAQVGPSVLPSNSEPLALWLSEDLGVAPAQNRGPREDSCSSQSVYQNFRRWQRYKPLAQIYLPQASDTAALACFFIPVLRSLGRLEPTMTVEEGLQRAMREWQCTSNYERMEYYDMAAKFMEFEAEEEMQAAMLQCSHGEQGLQSPTTPMPELQGAPLPAVGQQPVCVPRNAGPQAVPQIRTDEQQLPRTQAPPEIPPEAVQEYIDIMNELLKGPALEEVRNEQEEEAQPWSNSNVLSYVDELCSQENFVTQAETIIQPRFLDHLLSPDPQLDISALAEELEGVEGLIPSQLADEHRPALHEDQAGKAMTPKDSSAEEIAADHGALSPTQAHRRGASNVTCVPSSRSGHPSRPIPPKASLVALPTLESRADHFLGQDPPGMIMPGSSEGSSEEKALSSLASLLASQQSLEPCGVPLSPAPAPGPQSTRSRARPRTRLPSRRAIHTSGPNSASSLNQGSGPTEQTPKPEAPPRMQGVYRVTFVPDSPTLSPRKRALSSSPARATGPCCPRGREGLRPHPPQRRAFQLPGPTAAPSKRRRVCVGSESPPAEQTPRSEKTRIQYRGVTVELDGHTLPLDRLQPVVVLRRIKIPGLP
ncbi:NUT family member 2G-like [Suncus etruscus]|uniref:NUT family member 2G-like n=1 Tax=Suncus etruscus TaxID=109475 RepID=UPI00210F4CD0|nr:NUT family member 2G-like [Suncus etruscus]